MKKLTWGALVLIFFASLSSLLAQTKPLKKSASPAPSAVPQVSSGSPSARDRSKSTA